MPLIFLIKNIKNSKKKNKDLIPYLKGKKHSLTLSNKNLSNINDGNIKLLCENIELKRKNEELISKINSISKEFNEIKKDNIDIKEELKEKNNIINNIKLTMDIFNQELIRLQNEIQVNKNSKNNANNNNKNKNLEKIHKLNIKGIDLGEHNEKTPSTGIGYTYDKNKKISSNEINILNNNSKNSENNNNSISDENNISLAENININEEEYKKALNKCNNNKIKKRTNSHFINNLNLMGNQKNNEMFSDFNQEFLRNADNFSESWRKEVEKMLLRKGINNK